MPMGTGVTISFPFLSVRKNGTTDARSLVINGVAAMTQLTDIAKLVDSQKFLEAAINVETVSDMDQLLAKLPIVADDVPTFDDDVRCTNWKEGSLHWLPVGKDLGNSGRIKL